MNKFLTGALLGLVAGLLLAPQKGEELRGEIIDTADRLKRQLNRLVGTTDASLEELKDILDKNIDGLNDDVKHRILTILDEAEELAYNTKTQLTAGIA